MFLKMHESRCEGSLPERVDVTISEARGGVNIA